MFQEKDASLDKLYYYGGSSGCFDEDSDSVSTIDSEERIVVGWQKDKPVLEDWLQRVGKNN